MTKTVADNHLEMVEWLTTAIRGFEEGSHGVQELKDVLKAYDKAVDEYNGEDLAYIMSPMLNWANDLVEKERKRQERIALNLTKKVAVEGRPPLYTPLRPDDPPVPCDDCKESAAERELRRQSRSALWLCDSCLDDRIERFVNAQDDDDYGKCDMFPPEEEEHLYGKRED